jgi:hypothetical protein
MANYRISLSSHLRIILILTYQLSLMSFTLRASQSFTLSMRGPLTRQADSYKILVQSTYKIPYAHAK